MVTGLKELWASGFRGSGAVREAREEGHWEEDGGASETDGEGQDAQKFSEARFPTSSPFLRGHLSLVALPKALLVTAVSASHFHSA